jgi:tetratricopeptide (TPR) repeat protein
MLDLEAGRLDAARAELKEIDALLPKIEARGKEQLAYFQEYLRGEILLAEGAPDKAAAVLQKLPPIGKPPTMPAILPFYSAPFLKDALARAYLAQGALDKAVAEYERLITFDPGKEDRSLINPRYHYRLAKLYERKGLAEKALEQYRKFLVLWKDADRDLPEYVDATKRLASLEKR